MSTSLGQISIENFWNEDLKKVEIFYQRNSNIIESVFILYNLEDKRTIKDIHNFSFDLKDKMAWKTKIVTKSGQFWSSGDYLPCQIKDVDNGKVTINFNGNSKEMSIIYPVSSSCSKEMY